MTRKRKTIIILSFLQLELLYLQIITPPAISLHIYQSISSSSTLTFSFSLFFPFHASLIMDSSNPSAPNQYQERPQTAPFQVQSTAPALWSIDLCDCFDDVPNCKHLTFSCGQNIVFISISFHLI